MILFQEFKERRNNKVGLPWDNNQEWRKKDLVIKETANFFKNFFLENCLKFNVFNKINLDYLNLKLSEFLLEI